MDFLRYDIKTRNCPLHFAVNSGAKVAEKIEQPLREKNPQKVIYIIQAHALISPIVLDRAL